MLRSLPEPGKRAVVMVTHDGAAAVYGDRIVHIRDGLIDNEETVVRPEEESPDHIPTAEPIRPPPAHEKKSHSL